MGKLLILVFIISFLSAFGFIFVTNNPTVARAVQIVSPIPSYFMNTKQAQTLNIWQPNEENVLKSSIEKPQVTAKAAYIYDLTTDTVLYDKNGKERLPIASLVKIATAIVALESKEPSTKVTVSQKAATIGENTMGITFGETYTLEELLYGLVLHSGNDAAVAIAESVAGNDLAFAEKMNEKAGVLGLADTHFANPSGLEEDNGKAGEYSTARDLVTLTKHALTLPVFAKVAEAYEYHIPYTSYHKELWLYNQTNLLTTYPGVKGVKTGYTPSAGLCLVTYAEKDGHKLIGVILNSEQRREEMRELLDYSFSALGVKVPGRI